MKDPETQAALNRITEANSWTAAWIWCAIASLATLEQVIEDWNRWTLHGRVMGGILVAVLIALPISLIIQVKRHKSIPISGLIVMAYVLLNLATLTFRPGLQVR